MAKAGVYINEQLAGYLEKEAGVFRFWYAEQYYSNTALPPISLTLPKTMQCHESKTLFPFFFGLLAEGINKDIQCRLLHIDEADDFTRLLQTAGTNTIGAVTVKELE